MLANWTAVRSQSKQVVSLFVVNWCRDNFKRKWYSLDRYEVICALNVIHNILECADFSITGINTCCQPIRFSSYMSCLLRIRAEDDSLDAPSNDGKKSKRFLSENELKISKEFDQMVHQSQCWKRKSFISKFDRNRSAPIDEQCLLVNCEMSST